MFSWESSIHYFDSLRENTYNPAGGNVLDYRRNGDFMPRSQDAAVDLGQMLTDPDTWHGRGRIQSGMRLKAMRDAAELRKDMLGRIGRKAVAKLSDQEFGELLHGCLERRLRNLDSK